MPRDLDQNQPPGSPDDPSVFCVALPMGTEGPYSRFELRQLVSTGRIKPDDRLMQEGIGHPLGVVADLIPDARELASRVEKDRRRSTSGEHRAQRPGSSSEIRRYRDSTTSTRPISESVPVIKSNRDAAFLNRRSSLIIKVLTILIVGLSSLLIMTTSLFDGTRSQSPITQWRVAKLGMLGGPWVFTLKEEGLDIQGPNGHVVSSKADVQREDDYHTVITITPPHPDLGSSVSISASVEVEVRDRNVKGSGQPVPDR